MFQMKMGASLLANRLSGTSLGMASRSIRPYRAMQFATKADLGKTDLIQIVAEKSQLTRVEAKSAVEGLIDSIMNAVAKGEKVSIVGFGSFERTIRAARKGRNPRTGEELQIEEKGSPVFRAGKVFKDTVNTAYKK